MAPYVINSHNYNQKIHKIKETIQNKRSQIQSQRVSLRLIRSIAQNQQIPTLAILKNNQKLLFANGKLEVQQSSLMDFYKQNLKFQSQFVQEGQDQQPFYNLRKRKRRTYKKDLWIINLYAINWWVFLSQLT